MVFGNGTIHRLSYIPRKRLAHERRESEVAGARYSCGNRSELFCLFFGGSSGELDERSKAPRKSGRIDSGTSNEHFFTGFGALWQELLRSEGAKNTLVHEFLPISGKNLERTFARLEEGLKGPFVLRGSAGWLENKRKMSFLRLGSAPGPGETQKTLQEVRCHCTGSWIAQLHNELRYSLPFWVADG